MTEKHFKKHVVKYLVGIIVVIVSTLIALDYFCYGFFIDKGEKPTLAQMITFFGAIVTLWLLFRRIELQIRQRRDDRFTAAVTLLGNSKTSARTGAVYALYNLALEEEQYRVQVAQILCSHIQSKTGSKNYQEKYSERPSNEIQTAINLLVRDDTQNKGLYLQNFANQLPPPDFSHAYLVKAKFWEAQCQDAKFWKLSAKMQSFGSPVPGCGFLESPVPRGKFFESPVPWGRV